MGALAENEPLTPRQLDRSLASGLAWTSLIKWSSQVLTWVSTVLVARLLSPEDYGLVSMAALYLGLVTLMSEAGIGAAVVIQRQLTRQQIQQLNTLAVGSGVLGLLVTLALAGPIGAFFQASRLPLVIGVMGVSFTVAGFRIVPQALLGRDMRFKTLALIEGSQAIVAAAATLILAYAGAGYWALVAGPLCGAAFWTIATVVKRPESYARPRRASIAPTIGLSRDILISRISWYAYSNADFLIAGKFLGQTALGYYAFGWSLATIAIAKVSAMVGRVTPAIFSAVQDRPAEMRRYLLLLTQALALVTFPATVGLGLVADDFVLLVLGEKWTGAIWPLRLLALYATIRSVTPSLYQVLNTVGASAFAMHVSVLSAFVMPIGFYIGSHWGTTGIAATWVILDPILTLPVLVAVGRRIQMRPFDFIRATWPATSGCLAMVAVVMTVRQLMGDHGPLWLVLAVQILAGAVAYSGAVLLLHGERVAHLRAAVKRLRSEG